MLGLEVTEKPTTTIASTIYMGHRMQTLLYGAANLRKALGLYLREEVISSTPEGLDLPAMIDLYSGSDISRIEILLTFNLTLIPLDPSSVIPPFNNKYNTSISYSSTLPSQSVATSLYKESWILSGIGYKVAPGSIKDKRRKSNSPTYL